MRLNRWAHLLIFLTATLIPIADACAREVKGLVATVLSDGTITITLPEGEAVAVGDAVRIEADLPDIGPVAIATRWRIGAIDGATVVAQPDGAPSALPQRGYRAVITTEAVAAAKPPPKPPTAQTSLPKTPEEWRRLYAATLKVAEAGDPRAMFQLGHFLERGLGVTADKEVALRWYQAAAAKNEPNAANRLCLYHLGELQGRTKDWGPETAARMCRIGAEGGFGASMINYGLMNTYGVGIRANQEEAWRWFNAALKAGIPDAHYGLGMMLLTGRAGRSDPVAAARHLMNAFEDGTPETARAVMDLFKQAHPPAVPAFYKEVQRILKDAGAYQGAIDGKFGPASLAALERLYAERSRAAGQTRN